MSQYPQYPQDSQMPYAGPQVEVSRIPTSVRVIGITGIVLGHLTFLNHALGIVMFVGPHMNPYGSGYMRFNILNSVVFGVFAAVLIVASVGILLLQEWARKLLLGYAVLYSASTCIVAFAVLFYVIPQLVQPHVAAMPNATVLVAGMYIGATAVPFICMVLPVFILVYLRKPYIMAAFSPSIL